MGKEINRYVHTYVEYLLNRLKQVVNENDKNRIEELLINNGFNNYNQIQLKRLINDGNISVNFNIYESLENYRKLYELYEIENTEESENSTFSYEDLGDNNYLVTYNPENKYKDNFSHYMSNKEKYEFHIKLKSGINIEDVLKNESMLLKQLRNSDAHAANEVIINSNFDSQNIRFNCKDGIDGIEEINISNVDFSNLIANKSKEMYLKNLGTEYGLIKKTYEEGKIIESQITNENELDMMLEKFEIAKFKDKASEINSDEETIDYFERKSKFYIQTSANCPSWGIKDDKFAFHEEIESFEISEEDKEWIKKYINTINGFYSKNYSEQHEILTQIIRKKYMSQEYYTLEKITQKAIKNSTHGIGKDTINKYMNNEEVIPEDEIKEIISLIIKAVFLTNKKKFETISESIDISGFNNIYVKPNARGNITTTRIVNRIRDVFTHYRFLLNAQAHQNGALNWSNETENYIKNNIQSFRSGNNNTISLETPILMYDCDNSNDHTLTYVANATLFDFLKFALQSTLTQEISEQTKESDEDKLENIEDAEKEFMYIQNIASNPTFFKKLDEEKRKNKDIIKFALLCDWKNIQYVDKTIFEKDEEFLKECIDLVPYIYEYLEGYFSNKEVFKYTLSKYGRAIVHADKQFFTKENIIEAITKLKENDDIFTINDITLNIPDEYFGDYEFVKKICILLEGRMWLFSKKYPEIYAQILMDEEVAIAVEQFTFRDYFEEEIKKDEEKNKRILEERRKYIESKEEIRRENEQKRNDRNNMLKNIKEELYSKFLEASEKAAMRRIAAKSNKSGVQGEGATLLKATINREQSEVGDNND